MNLNMALWVFLVLLSGDSFSLLTVMYQKRSTAYFFIAPSFPRLFAVPFLRPVLTRAPILSASGLLSFRFFSSLFFACLSSRVVVDIYFHTNKFVGFSCSSPPRLPSRSYEYRSSPPESRLIIRRRPLIATFSSPSPRLVTNTQKCFLQQDYFPRGSSLCLQLPSDRVLPLEVHAPGDNTPVSSSSSSLPHPLFAFS